MSMDEMTAIAAKMGKRNNPISLEFLHSLKLSPSQHEMAAIIVQTFAGEIGNVFYESIGHVPLDMAFIATKAALASVLHMMEQSGNDTFADLKQ
jgi:hypothetical protein